MKQIICVLLCIILTFWVFAGPFTQKVEAVAVSASVIAIIIAALAGLGITFTTTAGYATVEDYVASLLQQYADSLNTSVSDLTSNCEAGVNRLGQLLLNNRWVQLINGFVQWIRVALQLADNSELVVQNETEISGITAYICDRPYVYWTYDNKVCLFNYDYTAAQYQSRAAAYAFVLLLDDGTYRVGYFSENQNALYDSNIEYFVSNEGSKNSSKTYFNLSTQVTIGGHTLYNPNYYIAIHGVKIPYISNLQIPSMPFAGYQIYTVSEFARQYGEMATITKRTAIQTGVITLPTDNTTYDEGDGAVIDIRAPWGSTWQDILEQVIPGIVTGTTNPDVTITYDTEKEIGDQVTELEGEAVSSDAGAYTVTGLQEVFPFCIPLDLFNFVSCLAADPQVPVITWRFYVPRICDETITIDLSGWDTVAQILRTMELLLFCVGLAFVTRRIIRG